MSIRIVPLVDGEFYHIYSRGNSKQEIFLDKNDFFTQIDRQKELRELQQSKQYYSTQISAERKELEALKNNPATLEKYAREKYLMKRDNEELFLVSEKPDNSKN